MLFIVCCLLLVVRVRCLLFVDRRSLWVVIRLLPFSFVCLFGCVFVVCLLLVVRCSFIYLCVGLLACCWLVVGLLLVVCCSCMCFWSLLVDVCCLLLGGCFVLLVFFLLDVSCPLFVARCSLFVVRCQLSVVVRWLWFVVC